MSDIELLVKRLQEGTFGSDITKTDAYLNTLMLQAAETIIELENKTKRMSQELSMRGLVYIESDGTIRQATTRDI